jgi:hypothetical protein
MPSPRLDVVETLPFVVPTLATSSFLFRSPLE